MWKTELNIVSRNIIGWKEKDKWWQSKQQDK